MEKKNRIRLAGTVFAIMLTTVLLITTACAEEDTGPAVTTGETIELKIANYFPAPARQSGILEEFSRELEERTGGRVKVDYFGGGSLLPPTGMYEGVVTGVADIGYSHVYYTSGRMPVTEATGLPLGYPSAWVAGHVFNDFYEKFRPEEWDDVVVLYMNASTPSAIATSDTAIRKLEDLQGLTIRAPGLAGDVIQALGGTPAPTPMPEVYDAISKGVLDGESSNLETLRAFKFAEVVNYSTSIWQITFPYPFYLVMNKDSYAKLPADIKVIFDELVGEYKERSIMVWNSVDFVGKATGEEQGVEFIDLSPAEVAKFKAAVAPVIDNYIEAMVDEGYTRAEVEGWIEYIRERIDFWTAKQIAWHIPSVAGAPELKP